MNRTQATLSSSSSTTSSSASRSTTSTLVRRPPAAEQAGTVSARTATRTVSRTVAARARDAEKRRVSIEDRMKAIKARSNTARLWKALLDQDQHWVPKGAWTAFGEASIRLNGLIVTADFTVDGVIQVADMDASYRKATVNFIWRKSAGIVSALAWDGLYGGGGGPYDDGRRDDFDSDTSLFKMVRDEKARRTWFNQLPLIAKLNEGIIAERDARIQRPVDLTSLMDVFFPPKKTTDSGILLP